MELQPGSRPNAAVAWDVVGSVLVVLMIVWLGHQLGAEAYGTPSGNIAAAGIFFLAVLATGLLAQGASKLFKIDLESVGCFLMLVMLSGTGGFLYFAGRWLLMLVGIVDRGGTPPSWLEPFFE